MIPLAGGDSEGDHLAVPALGGLAGTGPRESLAKVAA
jgi:hypothetical protein